MVHNSNKFDVLIGGASFAGLALARALSVSSQGQLRVGLIDRLPVDVGAGETSDGRAFALSAASVKMLEVIGVWQKLADLAQPILDIEITDSPVDAGERPIFLSIENCVDGEDPATYMIESGLLLSALKEAVLADPSVTLFAPSELNGLEADLNGATVELGSGDALVADLVVAADGRGSRLRDYAGIKTVGWSYDQVGLVATIAHEVPHHGRAVQHFLPSGPFAILPLKGNRVSLVWTEEADFAEQVMALDDDAFMEHVHKRLGSQLGVLTLVGGRGGFPLGVQLARRFCSDRLALVGDAAHGVHPLAGQGLNIGFRDVAALTECIVDGLRLGMDIGSDNILTRYERWRRFDATSSAFAMDGLNKLFSNDFGPVRALRDFGLKMVDRTPRLKDFFVREAAGFTGEVPRLLKGETL